MSEYTESEIRSKERRLQEIGRKVVVCIEKEKELNTELSRLRKGLISKSSFSRPEQIQRNIANQERRLEEVLREHERYEQERESLSRELERLRQSLEWEASFRRSEERRKQAQGKTKQDLSHAATFSAGIIAGATVQKDHAPSQKSKKQKGGALRSVGKVFLFLVIVGAILNAITPEKTEPPKQEDTRASAVMTEPVPPQNGMTQWIGSSAGEIFDQYGETDLTSYFNGGLYFYYEDSTACPYEFFIEDSGGKGRFDLWR